VTRLTQWKAKSSRFCCIALTSGESSIGSGQSQLCDGQTLPNRYCTPTILRSHPAHVDDADFSALLRLIFLSVESNGMRVRQKEIVPDTFAFVSTSMDVNVECLTG
jgi:hypothetical protein